MKKIRVGIVNYLNTRPLLYGLENSPVRGQIDFIPDYPSNIARDLREGKIDMGLVPVAIIPEMQEWHLVSDFCIGCDGPVASVCLFSEVPIDKIENVLLDYQSHTSLELTRILLRDHWKVHPKLVRTSRDCRDEIRGTTAGLVIGDRSFEQRRKSAFAYDLGQAWKELTGLPFVFAAWVSNKELDRSFVKLFNDANAYGIINIERVAADNAYPLFDMHSYYTRYISYRLDEKKQQGLNRFLELMKEPVSNETPSVS